MKSKSVEVEFDHRNRDWYFRPLGRKVRGRFMLSRVKEPTAMSFRNQIPEEVPPQRLGIDPETKTGYLIETIHDTPGVKSMIEKRNFRLEPARQEFPGVEADAWLFWMKAAVDAGNARVVSGSLPETINYDPPSQLLPQPKRGEARLREIFRNDPSLALEYQRMNQADQRKWESMVGA